MHALFHLVHAGLSPVPGHTGFEKVVVGKDGAVDTDCYAHYLHHKYFECNYADGAIPLDRWFGTFHDGSDEAHEAMRKRRVQGARRQSERLSLQRVVDAARAAFAFMAALLLAAVAQAAQSEALLQDGAYEVQVRLELPNMLSRAADRTTTICLPYADGGNGAPFPVLSSNNPLAKCPASNVERDGRHAQLRHLLRGPRRRQGAAVTASCRTRSRGGSRW